MYNINLPNFPEYIDDEYRHLSIIRLPAFAGMQTTSASYGAVPELGSSIGNTHAISNKHLEPKIFQSAILWVIEHDAEIRSKLFASLVNQYWEMRDVAIECLMDEDPDKILPEIKNPEDLAPLCRLLALHIGGMNDAGEPFFGIELNCNWEDEHGAGVQFEGLRVIQVGDASIAFHFSES